MYLRSFSYQMPTKIVYGVGSIRKLSDEIKAKAGMRILIITDKGVQRAGLVDKVKASLDCASMSVEVFDDVHANPTLDTVSEGVSVAKSFRPNVIIGLGGGSAMDTAKVIDMLLSNDGDLREYETKQFQRAKAVPLVAIPTTAGTGSEVTHVSVITDTERKHKFAVADFLLCADIALLDPELTVSLPPRITAETGFDALAHAVESFLSPNAHYVSDTFAAYAINLISSALREAVGNGSNIEARSKMLLGSMIAGMGFAQVGCGMGHGTGHALSAYYDLPHGATLGMMLPYVTEFNLIGNPAKYAQVAQLLDENISGLTTMEAAEKAAQALKKLAKDIGLTTLRDAVVDMNDDDLARVSEEASNDPCVNFNPRKVSIEDIKMIYEMALQGEAK